MWRGSPVSESSVLAAARAAAGGSGDAVEWLDSVFRDGVLAICADAGNESLRELDRRWHDAWEAFAAWCDAARRGEERWRAQPRDVGGGPGAGAVSFDDLAFVASGKLATPAQHTVNGPLLLAVTDEAYVDALRGETTAGMAEVAGYCPWFEGLWEKARRDNVGVVAVRQLLPQVQDDAATERRRESAAAQTRERAFDDATRALCDRVSEVLVVAPGGDEDLDLETVGRLQDALSGFQAACQEVQRLGPVAAGSTPFAARSKSCRCTRWRPRKRSPRPSRSAPSTPCSSSRSA